MEDFILTHPRIYRLIKLGHFGYIIRMELFYGCIEGVMAFFDEFCGLLVLA